MDKQRYDELEARIRELEARVAHLPARIGRGGGGGGGDVAVGDATPQVTADGSPGTAETAMRSDAQPRGQINDGTATDNDYHLIKVVGGEAYYRASISGGAWLDLSHFEDIS